MIGKKKRKTTRFAQQKKRTTCNARGVRPSCAVLWHERSIGQEREKAHKMYAQKESKKEGRKGTTLSARRRGGLGRKARRSGTEMEKR